MCRASAPNVSGRIHDEETTPPREWAQNPPNDGWDDAEIIIDIQHTEPGTALADHLRKEQTRAVLDLLADYKRKLDENGDAQP